MRKQEEKTGKMKGMWFLNFSIVLILLIVVAAFWVMHMNQGILGLDDVKDWTNGTIIQVGWPALDFINDQATKTYEMPLGAIAVLVIIVIVLFSKN